MRNTVFLFGESEKGEFGRPLLCRSLVQLLDTLGNPPEESLGMSYAIQALLYNRELLFCRVKEEGFSVKDYIKGLKIIKNRSLVPQLQAILIPGVGDQEVVEAALKVCSLQKSLLILTEKDLYDYLTSSNGFH